MSKKVGSKGKVLAVEPDPSNFAVLSRNIKDNNLRNVSAFQLALSDRDGDAQLTLSSSPAQHSIINRSVGSNSITVKTVKLDSLLKKAKTDRIDFLKVDVEEAEMKLLRGAPKTLRSKPRIVIENGRKGELDEFLKQRNYEVTWINEMTLFVK